MVKTVIFEKKRWVYGYDVGSGDKSTFVKGYFDNKGNFHVVEIKQFDD